MVFDIIILLVWVLVGGGGIVGKCYNCELTKNFIELDGCPVCGASPLLMSTKTHLAKCSFCKREFGVPRALSRLCAEEVACNRYGIYISEMITKEKMLAIAKILECTAATVYRKFIEYGNAYFEDVTMIQAYEIRKLFQGSDTEIHFTPPLSDYERFETCWDIETTVRVIE